MPNLLVWYTGDLNPSITETITTNGTVRDLTGLSAKFKMRAVGSSTLKVNAAVSNSLTTDGVVRYDWVAADVDTAATYLAWWEVTTSSKIQAVHEAVIEFRAHAPITNTYVELEELKATLNLTGTSYADQDVKVALEAAARAVDGYKDDRFYASTETRYYTPSRSDRYLVIDPLNTLTSVAVDMDGDGVYETTWTNGTDFVLEPSNAATAGFPYTKLTLLSQAGRVFPGYTKSVKIIGSFGWASAPAAVKQATRILAGRFLKRARETPYGIVVVTGDAVAAARLGRIDPDVAFLLDNLPGSVPLLAI